MKTYYFIIIFFLSAGLFFTSCNSNNANHNIEKFKEVSLENEDFDCISEYQHEFGKVANLSGKIVFHKIKDTDAQILLIKDSAGLTYMPCGLPEQYEKEGLKIIFSGINYGPDSATDYAYLPSGGFLKLTKFWVEK